MSPMSGTMPTSLPISSCKRAKPMGWRPLLRWDSQRGEHRCRRAGAAAGTLAGAVLLRAMVPLSDAQAGDLSGKGVLLLSGAADPIIPPKTLGGSRAS